MELRDFITQTAGLLGFNKVYNRANNAHVIELIEERFNYCLDYIASTKSFINNQDTILMTAVSIEPKVMEIETGYVELYEYYIPSNFLGYVSDTGRYRVIQGDRLFSDVVPEKKLWLTFKKEVEVKDIPKPFFNYFCAELALMVAPALGIDDKRISFITSMKTEYLKSASTATKASRNVDVFGFSNMSRGRRRV
ncbi:MAG: hypothetical protein ACRCYT_07785 [Cetobacterium sp.]